MKAVLLCSCYLLYKLNEKKGFIEGAGYNEVNESSHHAFIYFSHTRMNTQTHTGLHNFVSAHCMNTQNGCTISPLVTIIQNDKEVLRAPGIILSGSGKLIDTKGGKFKFVALWLLFI